MTKKKIKGKKTPGYDLLISISVYLYLFMFVNIY